MSEKIRLLIKGLSYSQTQTGAYALVLGEENGPRKLPVIIGGFEAQSIAIALEKEVEPPRPLTHDLFKNFAEKFSIHLKEVVIHKLLEGVFFSLMIFEKDGKDEVMDARTSDAVALAIRFGAPIYTYENVLEKAGVILDDKKPEKKREVAEKTTAESAPSGDKSIQGKIKELQKRMDEAVRKEDYELAARLRDEIDKLSA
ncbi:MAG: bifunctional nuclease family protein [Cryomorphaceae bacterium]|nr:bifunctional nuclease family protein [Cryomorphaceae bacterium]